MMKDGHPTPRAHAQHDDLIAEYEADLAAERASWQDEDDAADEGDTYAGDLYWAQQDGADDFYNGEDK
jgi:hypothetical protein